MTSRNDLAGLIDGTPRDRRGDRFGTGLLLVAWAGWVLFAPFCEVEFGIWDGPNTKGGKGFWLSAGRLAGQNGLGLLTATDGKLGWWGEKNELFGLCLTAVLTIEGFDGGVISRVSVGFSGGDLRNENGEEVSRSRTTWEDERLKTGEVCLVLLFAGLGGFEDWVAFTWAAEPSVRFDEKLTLDIGGLDIRSKRDVVFREFAWTEAGWLWAGCVGELKSTWLDTSSGRSSARFVGGGTGGLKPESSLTNNPSSSSASMISRSCSASSHMVELISSGREWFPRFLSTRA
jgi:hypothetical protein